MAHGTAKSDPIIHIQCCQKKARAEGASTHAILSCSFSANNEIEWEKTVSGERKKDPPDLLH